MPRSIEERLADLSITLPKAAAPAANYVPFVTSNSLVFISGQLPIDNGTVAVTGIVGRDVDVEAAQRAAQLCAINILSQTREALDGDLERIVRVVKIQGFVASTPDFTDQHLVVNGASNLIADILGDRGKHARAAIGVPSLPMNASVEIDAIVEVR